MIARLYSRNIILLNENSQQLKNSASTSYHLINRKTATKKWYKTNEYMI